MRLSVRMHLSGLPRSSDMPAQCSAELVQSCALQRSSCAVLCSLSEIGSCTFFSSNVWGPDYVSLTKYIWIFIYVLAFAVHARG